MRVAGGHTRMTFHRVAPHSVARACTERRLPYKA
jgi:hypothetical protein